MNIVSYSVYGSNPKYLINMPENIRRAEILFPGWEVRVYHDETVPAAFLAALRDIGCLTVDMTACGMNGLHNGSARMLWRFLAILEGDASIMRDSDSLLSQREAVAVWEWLRSECPLHSMHDSSSHLVNPDPTKPWICGGMWGCRGPATWPNMLEQMVAFCRRDHSSMGIDQDFLNEIIVPQFCDTIMTHSYNPRGGAEIPLTVPYGPVGDPTVSWHVGCLDGWRYMKTRTDYTEWERLCGY